MADNKSASSRNSSTGSYSVNVQRNASTGRYTTGSTQKGSIQIRSGSQKSSK